MLGEVALIPMLIIKLNISFIKLSENSLEMLFSELRDSLKDSKALPEDLSLGVSASPENNPLRNSAFRLSVKLRIHFGNPKFWVVLSPLIEPTDNIKRAKLAGR